MNKNILVIIACAGMNLWAMDMASIEAGLGNGRVVPCWPASQLEPAAGLNADEARLAARVAGVVAAAPHISGVNFNEFVGTLGTRTFRGKIYRQEAQAWCAVPGTSLVVYAAFWRNRLKLSATAVTAHALDITPVLDAYYCGNPGSDRVDIRVVTSSATCTPSQQYDDTRMRNLRARQDQAGDIICDYELVWGSDTSVNKRMEGEWLSRAQELAGLRASLPVDAVDRFIDAVGLINAQQSLAERAAINYINSNLAAIQAGSKQEVTKAQTMLADVPPAHRRAIGAYFGLEL